MKTSARAWLANRPVRELRAAAEACKFVDFRILPKEDLISQLDRCKDAGLDEASEARLAVWKTLSELKALAPISSDSLDVLPFTSSSQTTGARALSEELEQGSIEITEVASGGVVPELLLRKLSDGRTLLLEGEELVGGNQNRILNTTILLNQKGDTVVPVTCIERGRWSESSSTFASTRSHLSSELRTYVSSTVTSSLSSRRRHFSDQGGMWSRISSTLDRTGTRSRTENVLESAPANDQRIKDIEGNLSILEEQIGYLALLSGKPLRMEMFSSHETFARYWSKLARGLALDSVLTPDVYLEQPLGRPVFPKLSEIIAKVLAAEIKVYPSIGIGLDARIESGEMVGSALVNEGVVEHLVFHWKSDDYGW